MLVPIRLTSKNLKFHPMLQLCFGGSLLVWNWKRWIKLGARVRGKTTANCDNEWKQWIKPDARVREKGKGGCPSTMAVHNPSNHRLKGSFEYRQDMIVVCTVEQRHAWDIAICRQVSTGSASSPFSKKYEGYQSLYLKSELSFSTVFILLGNRGEGTHFLVMALSTCSWESRSSFMPT